MQLTQIAGNCPDKIDCPGIYLTDRGTAVVRGDRITDPAALAQMGLPPHETAVEIPLSLLEEQGQR